MAEADRQIELRLMLASMGVLAAAIAVLTAALAPPAWDHCLPTVAAVHCPACYVAAMLFAAALLPWPPTLVRVRR